MDVLGNCFIFDADNWSCPGGQSFGMREGNLVLGDEFLKMRPVSHWRYKYLRAKGWLR